jgi:hypothetical protein
MLPTVSVRVHGELPGRAAMRATLRRVMVGVQGAIAARRIANLSGRYVRRRTGRLLRGERAALIDQFESTGTFTLKIRNIMFYGAILETGAAEHRVPGRMGRVAMRNALARAGRITPGERRAGEAAFLRGERVRQKMLRFQVGGRWVFVRSVVIPPLRPRPWASAALAEALPELRGILQRAFDAMAQGHERIAG